METIQEWVAKLKRLATYCEFGSGLEVALRDRFIVGIRNSDILNRLFRESDTLTFVRAVEIASQIEAAKLNVNEITKGVSSLDFRVHRYEEKNKPGGFKNGFRKDHRYINGESRPARQDANYGIKVKEKNNRNCYVCGKLDHVAKNCKYVNYKCRNCDIVGHLAKVCRRKDFKDKGLNKSNKCYWNTGEDESRDTTEVDMYNLHIRGSKPIMAKVIIGKIPVEMEIDSGSGVSTMSQELYKKYFMEYKLNPSEVVLVGYTQNRDKPVGVFRPKIRYDNITVTCALHVVANGGPPLFGRDLMQLCGLGLARVHSVKTDISLQTVLEQHKEVFKQELGRYKYGTVTLNLKKEAKPIFCRPRVIPFVFRQPVEKELERLQNIGMITPIESSDWGTPLVPVLKHNGSIRLCADYKVTLNKYLEEVKYPLPRVEELFTRLQGGQQFSKLDLSQAYNQIGLDEQSQMLAVWSTHKGLFRVNRLPYGVSPAAARFQMIIEQILQGLEGVVSFIDDIVVTGKDKVEHLNRLKTVLERLEKAGLRLQANKCEFFRDQITYLGHRIDKMGLHKNPEKVLAIKKATTPTTVSEVRSLIGMVSYCGKFVSGLAEIMNPLYQLLKKGTKFVWSRECEDAFKKIKEIMCTDTVLAHYDPEKQIKLSCDASMLGIGAVLAQVDEKGISRPVAFTARMLSAAEKNYSMIEKEALAIYHAVKYFHQYLYGRRFILVTDHKPLLAIFGEHKGVPVMAAGRLQRWALFLSGYQYKIEGIKGKENWGPDFLSRTAVSTTELLEEENAISNYLHFIESKQILPIDSKCIGRESGKDQNLAKVMEFINNGWPEMVPDELKPYFIRRSELTIEQRCVMWGHRVLVPKKLRSRLLDELHATHLGVVKMKSTARSVMWWPKIDKEIEEVSKKCAACTSNRQDPGKATLIPWQGAQAPWDRIHMDYVGPFKGKMYLIIIDAFSKWPEVLEVKEANTEQTIEKLRDLCARFGLPNVIVTDNGTQFTSEKFRDFVKRNGILHKFTAPGHPATNGQAENGVKTFKQAVYKAVADPRNSKVEIHTLIARFLLGYRNAIHCTTTETPAKLMLGRQLKVRLSLIKPSLIEVVREKNDKQIEHYKGRRSIIFEEGQTVSVRDYSRVNHRGWKIARIEKKLGQRTYLCKLEDGRTWKRHVNQMQGNIEVQQDGDGAEDFIELDEGSEIKKTIDPSLVDKPESIIIDQTVIGNKEGVLMSSRERPKRIVRPPDRLEL